MRHIMASDRDARLLAGGQILRKTVGGSVGKHLLIECYGKQSCMDAAALENLMTQAAQVAGATILSSHFHAFGEGMGFTGVLVLAESHITVHTWPENNYAAFDVFMCGDCQPHRAAELIVQADPESITEVRAIERGRVVLHGDQQQLTETVEVS